MKKYLLIGGEGFIGQNLSEELKKNNLVSIADCVDRSQIYADGTNYYKCDYFNEGLEDNIIEKNDVVVLLACTVGPKTSMDNYIDCYDNNINALVRLLEQMRKLKKNRLVFISSGGTVYGEHEEAILNEEAQNFPINHYGILKLAQEKIILMYNELFGMDNIIFRLSNPYGIGQQVASGIGAVTAILDSILQSQAIHIWGDGENIRDYIYVKDAVKMMEKMMDIDSSVYNENAIFNIGTGVGTSINELIKIVENITGKKAVVNFQEKRLGDVTRNVLDVTKVKKYIGEYECMSVEEGIEKYYRLYREK